MEPSGFWCLRVLFPSSVTRSDMGDQDLYFLGDWWQTLVHVSLQWVLYPAFSFQPFSFPFCETRARLQHLGREAEVDPVVFWGVIRLCWRVGLAVYEEKSIYKGYPDQVSAKFLKAADSDVANYMVEISRGSILLLWMISNARKPLSLALLTAGFVLF